MITGSTAVENFAPNNPYLSNDHWHCSRQGERYRTHNKHKHASKAADTEAQENLVHSVDHGSRQTPRRLIWGDEVLVFQRRMA